MNYYFDIGGVIFKNGMDRFLNKITEEYPIDQADDTYGTYKEVFHIGNEARQLRKGTLSFDEFIHSQNKTLIKSYDFDLLDYLSEREVAEMWFDEYMPIDGILNVIKLLNKKGNKVGIMSANFSERFDYLFEKHDLMELFDKDEIYLSYQINVDKRDPNFYSHIIEIGNLKPANCFYIDDKSDFVQTAQKAGIDAHLYDHTKGESMEDVLSQIPELNDETK